MLRFAFCSRVHPGAKPSRGLRHFSGHTHSVNRISDSTKTAVSGRPHTEGRNASKEKSETLEVGPRPLGLGARGDLSSRTFGFLGRSGNDANSSRVWIFERIWDFQSLSVVSKTPSSVNPDLNGFGPGGLPRRGSRTSCAARFKRSHSSPING